MNKRQKLGQERNAPDVPPSWSNIFSKYDQQGTDHCVHIVEYVYLGAILNSNWRGWSNENLRKLKSFENSWNKSVEQKE